MDLESLYSAVKNILTWTNENQGVLTLVIFLVTILFGWLSGIFSALRQRPRLCVRLIEGPTFSCTFPTGKKHGEFDEHQTGIALYLHITNRGNSPTSISAIEIGYHWHLKPISIDWFKFRVGWFWLRNQSVALEDFQVAIGGSIKVYPFLTQVNHLSPARPSTYLQVGEVTNGVVYFEQQASWGGCFPSPRNGFAKIRLRLRDAHGRKYVSTHQIPVVSIEEALKYNPSFGSTHRELHGEILPLREIEVEATVAESLVSEDSLKK